MLLPTAALNTVSIKNVSEATINIANVTKMSLNTVFKLLNKATSAFFLPAIISTGQNINK